jgi:hypothetical protein
MAGLPHLLMAALIGLGKLEIFDISETSQIISGIGIFLVILVAAILVLAWTRGWPLWTASWYLYGTYVILALVGFVIGKLNLEDSWRYTNALFLGWILLCVVGYGFILSKSRLHGLLSVAFLFPLLGVMYLEFIPNPIEGWLVIGLGALTALTVGAIVRRGDFRSGLWSVLAVNLIAGLSLAYVGEYQMVDLPPSIPAHTPKFDNFIELSILYSLFAFGTLSLPFILRGLWTFGKRKFS